MYITKEFLDNVGKRSPMARDAMRQAGDRYAIEGLKLFLINYGACVISKEDIEKYSLKTIDKNYFFMSGPLHLVLVPDKIFNYFARINDNVELEVAHIKNGCIGLRLKEVDNNA